MNETEQYIADKEPSVDAAAICFAACAVMAAVGIASLFIWP